MGIQFTDEQQRLIKEAVRWYKYDSEQVLQYSAPAGAGKSTVMHAIINELGLLPDEVAPMTYIGSAAIVMRVNGFYNACTAHSWLYELVEELEKHPLTGKIVKKLHFVRKPLDRNKIKLICVDEGGTIPYSMKKDIESNGIKVLVCGDLDQLPPVLDKPAYLYTGKVHRLTKIMRQSKFSSIIEISNMLRNGYTPKIGDYGDVLVIYRSDLVNEMIMASDSIICGTNRTREYFNEMIRRDLLGFKSKLPQYGEKVVCRKNNWHIEVDGINLANGLSGRVSSTTSISKFDGVKFKINFTPDLFPDIVFEDIECDYQYFIADFKARRQMKNLSAIAYGDTGEKFEFGYSITTHMSQGNQYRNGIYIQEYLNPEIQRNLNYTGLTRFRNKCIYVLPSKKTMIHGFRPRVLKKSVVSLNGEPII